MTECWKGILWVFLLPSQSQDPLLVKEINLSVSHGMKYIRNAK